MTWLINCFHKIFGKLERNFCHKLTKHRIMEKAFSLISNRNFKENVLFSLNFLLSAGNWGENTQGLGTRLVTKLSRKSRWPESGRVRVKTLAENISPFLLFQLFTLARYAIALFMINYDYIHRSKISCRCNPEN